MTGQWAFTYLVTPQQSVSLLVLGLVPYFKELLLPSRVSPACPGPSGWDQGGTDMLTLMPHSLTKSACFFASGHSRAVPKALHRTISMPPVYVLDDKKSTSLQ